MSYQFGAECRAPGDVANGPFSTCFVHASNAALSGSPQDGPDDLYHRFYVDHLAGPTFASGTLSSHGNGGPNQATSTSSSGQRRCRRR